MRRNHLLPTLDRPVLARNGISLPGLPGRAGHLLVLRQEKTAPASGSTTTPPPHAGATPPPVGGVAQGRRAPRPIVRGLSWPKTCSFAAPAARNRHSTRPEWKSAADAAAPGLAAPSRFCPTITSRAASPASRKTAGSAPSAGNRAPNRNDAASRTIVPALPGTISLLRKRKGQANAT